MTDDSRIDRLLQQAARLRTLVALARARRRGNPTPPVSKESDMDQSNQTTIDGIEPDAHARALAADLLARMTLDPSTGQPFGSEVEADEADAEPEFVRLGPVRLRVIDGDPTDLAMAAGAIEEGAAPSICLLVEFDQGDDQPQASMGQYIVLPTDDDVSLVFYVWLTHGDLHDPEAPDLAPGTVRNEALDAIADNPGRALLVQVLDEVQASQ